MDRRALAQGRRARSRVAVHRFWASVVRPLLEACEPAVVVEVGAASGAHTRRLGPWCEAHGATLHVVDPAPRFDHESAPWARHAVFHRVPSLAVLDRLGPVAVALLDGDHNWYTVIGELRLLASTAHGTEGPPPVVLCHDVLWPYGRRDLYYDPDRIPDEHRQPWRRAGVEPGRAELVPAGGLNRNLANAEHEGGPRNGVMTAIEDFIEESDDTYELTVLPVLHGLGILVPTERLAANDALADQLARWRSRAGWRKLAELTEADRQRMLARRATVESYEPPSGEPPGEGRRVAAPPGREPRTAVPAALLASIQRGVMASRYRGREFLKSPFDVLLYLQLIDRLRPRTVIEVGTKDGGSALWFADTLANHGIEARVITIDTVPPEAIDDARVETLTGNALTLGEVLTEDVLDRIGRPLLVVEDSAHTFDACRAVLDFFDRRLAPGDYIVVEDGNAAFMPDPAYDAYEDGPNRAVAAFLKARGEDFTIDESLCDHFGYNVTWSPNAWLRRE